MWSQWCPYNSLRIHYRNMATIVNFKLRMCLLPPKWSDLQTFQTWVSLLCGTHTKRELTCKPSHKSNNIATNSPYDGEPQQRTLRDRKGGILVFKHVAWHAHYQQPNLPHKRLLFSLTKWKIGRSSMLLHIEYTALNDTQGEGGLCVLGTILSHVHDSSSANLSQQPL
jgi:hypothetical protein